MYRDNGVYAVYCVSVLGVGFGKVGDNENNIIDLGTMDGTYSYSFAINDNGQVAGYVNYPDGDINNNTIHAFVTDSENNMIDLGTLGGTRSYANVINNRGQVAGWAHVDGDQTHAFVTDSENNMIDLGTLGGTRSDATAINESGQVTGYALTADGYSHAFIADSQNNMIDLGTLGGTSSYARAINNSGQVIGLSGTMDDQTHAFITDSENNMIDLNDLVDNLSNDWDSLDRVTDISDTGYIIGQGYTINGESHAFLLTPIDTDNNGFEMTKEPRVLGKTDSSVIIKWGTNIDSDSLVEYGIEGTDFSSINEKQTQNHLVKIGDLDEGTTYQYRVISTTDEGDVITSEAYNFTTQSKKKK